MNFPNSPEINDIFTIGDKSWRWNGYAWDLVSASYGPQGTQGIQGIQGIQGVAGEKGDQGASLTIIGSVDDVNVDPPNDPQVLLASAFPTAIAGNGVIDKATGDLWAYDGSVWDNVGKITGPQGTQGVQGVFGPQGTQGTNGIQGVTGSQGTQGIQGTQGLQGILGFQGIQGLQGEIGTQGLQGFFGTQGTQGISGYVGAQGVQGAQGIQGIRGPQGLDGIQGAQGLQGIQGTSAPSGVLNTQESTTDESLYPVMVTDFGVDTPPTTSSTKLYFNAGTGTLTAVNFNSLSDVNCKENLVSLDNGIDLLEKIIPYQFEWKHTGTKSYGVIAQEIEEFFPELVTTDNVNRKSVSYIPLIAILIDAVKTLNNKIEDIQRTQ